MTQKFSDDAYLRALQGLMPRGRAWPRSQDSVQAKVLAGLAPSFRRSDAAGVSLVAGAFPSSADDLLEEWEGALGLSAGSSTAAQRRAAVVAALVGVGGQSIADFVALAATLGYTIAIENLEPFRAGKGRVGDRIAVPGIVFCWRVSVYGVASADNLESVFQALKPAHTVVSFVYPAGSLAGAMSGSITVGTASLTGSIRLINARTDTFVPIAARACTCGVFSMTADGVWTYVLDSHDPDAIALPAKATLAESVTVSAADGSLSGAVLITVVGIDDAGTIGGGDSGSVTEDVTTTCSGVLTVTDPDTGEAVFVAQTTSSSYGTFVLAKSGSWTYVLGAGAQALPAGSTVSDTFTARSAGGASHVVSITITGTNDVPTITGTGTGSVAVGSATTVSGALGISDADTGESAFTAGTTACTYGSLTITSAGSWTYTLDASNSTVTGLAAGSTLTDQVAVWSLDKTASKTVTVTITKIVDSSYRGSVLADVPLIYWRLGETSGTVAADSSGHGYAGTYMTDASATTTASLLAGDADRATHCAGVSATAGAVLKSSPALTGPTHSWTAEIIARPTLPASGASASGTLYASTLNDVGDLLIIDTATGGFKLRVWSGQATSALVDPTVRAWGSTILVHLRQTASSKLDLFVNGALVATIASTVAERNTGWLSVGGLRSVYWDIYPFSGDLDDFAFYQSALADARIAARYAVMIGG